MTLFETKLGPEALSYNKPRIISNNKLDTNIYYKLLYKYNINLLHANNLKLTTLQFKASQQHTL